MGVDLPGSIAAIILAVLAALSWLWFKNRPSPAIAFSTPVIQGKIPLLSYLSSLCFGGAFLLLLLALADPYVQKETLFKRPPPGDVGKAPPIEGIAIYLVLDQSGSMEEKILNKDEQGKRFETSKLKLLKSITEKFIAGDGTAQMPGRENDLIGLVGFSRGAQVLSPLTLDHKELVNRLHKFDIMRVQDQDGTSIGYAIYKTANLIIAARHFAQDLIAEGKPAYTIQSYVIILVTDGVQETNPLDNGKKWRTIPVDEASKYAAENNIRLYIINVEPDFAGPKYALLRKELERDTAATGGKFFLAGDSKTLSAIYSEIADLEKSALPSSQQSLLKETPGEEVQKKKLQSFYLAPWLMALGAFLVLAAIVIDCIWLRRVP